MKKNLASLQLKTSSFAILALYLCVAFFYGCGGSNSNGSGEEPVLPENVNANANSGSIKYAQRLEMPKLSTSNSDAKFITYTTTYQGKEVVTFSLELDTKKRHANWVAFTFDPTTRTDNNAGRTDKYIPDPNINTAWQSDNTCFGTGGQNDGVDRGHICASEDRQYSKEANAQTFYFTNMSPQYSNFNQKIWAALEGVVQRWGRSLTNSSDTLFVVKGGTVNSGNTLNDPEIKIVTPQYYYMAVLLKSGKGTNPTYRSIAVLLEHRKTAYPEPYDLKSFATTVDEIEELTGLDLFCNLPDKTENAVEKQCNTSEWNWNYK